jgi:hypothetical protein
MRILPDCAIPFSDFFFSQNTTEPRDALDLLWNGD